MSFRDARSTLRGLGLAAAYIADHLTEWGVKPAGENGSVLPGGESRRGEDHQPRSVTVDVNGQTRTFKDGEGGDSAQHGRHADD